MTSLKYFSWITTCTVFIAFISVLLQAYWASQELAKLTTVMSGLNSLEHSINTHRTNPPRIAVGYGSCSDLYVRATSFLNFSVSGMNEDDENFVVEDIQTETELLRSFGYYFRKGAASERFTSNQGFFRKLIASSKSARVGEVRWALGGNAPVMGMRFAKEGAKVLLAAQMSKRLRQSIPNGIELTGEPIDYDDVHLIMEYKTNEQWGPYTAPRANRYILHNDQNNPTISSLENLDKQLPKFKPRLLVVSGLQMLDSYPFKEGVREDRLANVRHQISTQPKSTLIHFEMASYVEVKLLHLLVKHVIPFSDSIGMNEQELDNLQRFIETGRVSFASESNPRVAQALNQMRTVFKSINSAYYRGKSINSKRRMLTRIHVHTLAYQAILIVKDSQWKNTKNAAAKAALTAHRHVCSTDIVNPESCDLVLDDSFATSTNVNDDVFGPKRINIDVNDPVSCWDESITVDSDNIVNVEICVAPVLVCKVAKQTVGAGDNISAAGLILQV